MKLPLALLLGRTEHGAVSTSHGSTQLLDQVPLGEHNTGFIFSFTVKFRFGGGGEGGTVDTISHLMQPLLAMTSAWLSLRTSPNSITFINEMIMMLTWKLSSDSFIFLRGSLCSCLW